MLNRLKNLISPEKTAPALSQEQKPQARPDPDERSVTYKEQGDAHLRSGNVEEAKACYRHAIALDPRYAKAHSNLGFILREQGHQADAERCLKTALSIDPNIADAHYMLGTIFQMQRKPDDAVSAFHKALELDPDHEFARRDLCYLLFQQGKIDDAREVITKGITNNPGIADYHYYLGNLYTHIREFEKATACYRNALSIQPGYVGAHFNLGIAFQEQGNPGEAIDSYQRAISLNPDFADAHYNLGIVFLRDQHLLPKAEASFRRVLEIYPDNADAYYNLGNTLRELGRLGEAEDSFRRTIRIRPDHSDAHLNLGNTLKDHGWLDEAESSYRQVLRLIPGSAEAHSNLGTIQMKSGRLEEAVASFSRAIQINPDLAEVHSNLGTALGEMGRLEEAVASCRRAVQLKPEFAAAHINLSAVLKDMCRFVEAEASSRRALQINPDYAEAHYNLGSTLKDLGRFAEAEASFREALRCKPDYADVHSALIFTMDLMAGKDTASLQEERKRWDATHAVHLHQHRVHPNIADPGRRLRVGYVSGDFRQHSAVKVFGGMLTDYDRSQFDVYAYSNFKGPDDKVTSLFRQSATAWRSIGGLPDDAVAEMIRGDQIDILVDLSGHSSGNRLLVFARKPAPIQVTAWGYATSTGMSAMDAFFADPVVVPPEEKKYFAEDVRYLPTLVGAFFFEPFPDVIELPALSSGIITFGSLNRLAKVSDRSLRAWADVLLAIPRSRLMLKTPELDDAANRERVIGYFADAGVATDRVIVQGRTSWLEHVQAFNQIDIALDPFPHGGGVTALEGLMMGVPMVVLRWPTVTGRTSASIMTALELTGWIAESEDKYVDLAIQKARELDSLASLRRQLRSIFTSSVMGNPVAYARAVEHEYRQLWQEWCTEGSSEGR